MIEGLKIVFVFVLRLDFWKNRIVVLSNSSYIPPPYLNNDCPQSSGRGLFESSSSSSSGSKLAESLSSWNRRHEISNSLSRGGRLILV